MAKLVIRVEKKVSLIDEAFDDMECEGLFSRMQLKVFKAVYKTKVNGIYTLLRNGLRGYITTPGKDFFIAEEEGSYEEMIEKKVRFKRFLYGDENELKGNEEYKKFKSDRIVIKVMRNLKRGIIRTKDKAVDAALNGDQVIDFLMRIGITVSWEVVV